jgi:predicted alpha-1,2-mannosidase
MAEAPHVHNAGPPSFAARRIITSLESRLVVHNNLFLYIERVITSSDLSYHARIPMKIVPLLAALGLSVFQASTQPRAALRPVEFVDPFLGTGGHGHTYPGATVPFGMVQLSPDAGKKGWDWCSSYHFSDTLLAGFSHTHLSGTGCGDLGDILVTPVPGSITPGTEYRMRFSHDAEHATPGYYSVHLASPSILAELTTTVRAGFHRYTFPEKESPRIVINLISGQEDTPTDTYLCIDGDSLVTGYRFSHGWAAGQKVFFAARFSKPITHAMLADTGGAPREIKQIRSRNGCRAFLDFGPAAPNVVEMKVGISAVDIDGALRNLDTEIRDWDFERIRKSAEIEWNTTLCRVRAFAADTTVLETFYTALYHTMLAPTVYGDVDGRYRGADDSLHATKTFTNYTTFSLWDTYRAEHPLLTLVAADRVADMVNSMLAFGRESGALPVWPLMANETNCMVGYSSAPVIVDAFFKDFRGMNVRDAYAQLKKAALSNYRGLGFYSLKPRAYGYIPADKEPESVSKTLEYAYDDWCVSELAGALGERNESEYFRNRSMNYKNLYDRTTGFLRGRNSDGSWVTPFNPRYSTQKQPEYTEGNAWQYLWLVPHDPLGLIALMGGPEAFNQRLDSLFHQSSDLTGTGAPDDVSGLIGLYAQGNEPDHHVAYMYDYTGAHWKTEALTHRIMKEMYHTGPDGICGNEDCGQMSAWYVLSAMGIYPVNPVSGTWALGTPLLDSCSVVLGSGKTFTMVARHASPENYYVQSAIMSGRTLEIPFIHYQEIITGGKLEFILGKTPNTSWGRSRE